MDVISVEKIKKRIGKREVLKGINFSMGKGEIVGLIGENGAGKTTLMKVLLGLTNYQDGIIKVGDKEVPEVGS